MGQKIDSLIYVVVDGVEKASFDLSRVSSTRFNLNKDAKEIALYRSGSEEREFLEAFPTGFANILNRPFTQNFNLKGGEMVKFQFVPIEEDGKVNKINCGITFIEKETPAEQKVAAAPVVVAATSAAVAASDTAVAETAIPKTAAAATVSASTFEDRPLDGNRNRAFLIPAVVLLIALLVLSVSWFTLRGGKDNQLAKENNPDKKKEITNPVTKAKKEDVVKDQAVLPDDISGGGDGDDDDEENVSADRKSSANADSKTTASDSTSSKKSLASSMNSVRNRGVEGVAKNNKKRTKVSIKSIRKTLSAKSNRIKVDKFGINKPDSSLEARRTPVKQKSPKKNETVSSLNKVDNAISAKEKDERSKQVRQRIAENQNLSNAGKTNINQGLSDKSLLEIKKVYLKWEGDVDTGILINQKVIEEIQDANLFALMQKKEDADAELRINIKYEKDRNSPKNPLVTADMWLTNDFGTVLTPTAKDGETLWKYDGKLEKMPEKIVADVNGLVAEAKKEKEQSVENTANVKKAETPKTQIKPITNETAVLNENIKPVNKIDSDSSQVTKNQVDKNPEGKSLTDIKKVYLEWQGDIDTGVKIHQNLVETIQHSGMMNVMKDKKDADGTLKINIKKESDTATAKNPKVSADMWLINDKGKTLTPMENGKTAWKYSGELKKMPKKVIDDIGGLVTAEKEKNQ